MGVRYNSRDLRPADMEAAAKLLADAPRYATLNMRLAMAAQQAGSFPGWWFGTFADVTELRAVMCVDPGGAQVHSTDFAAVEKMATDLLVAQQHFRGGAAKRHQLMGEQSVLDRFWQIFRGVDREVVLNKTRDLMGTGEGPFLATRRITAATATAADLKAVVEFTGEYAVATWGSDPRVASREAHTRRCAAVIGDGRQLVAREGPRVILVAEVVPLDAKTVLLDNVHVPRGHRPRKKLVARALGVVAEAAAPDGCETLFFSNNDALGAAALMSGFGRRATYRVVVMRG